MILQNYTQNQAQTSQTSQTAQIINLINQKANPVLDAFLQNTTQSNLTNTTNQLNPSDFLKNIFQIIKNGDMSQNAIFEMLKNNPTIKSSGTFGENLQELIKMLKNVPTQNGQNINNLLTNIQNLQPQILQNSLLNSGIFLESNLMKMALGNSGIQDLTKDIKAVLYQLKNEIQNKPASPQGIMQQNPTQQNIQVGQTITPNLQAPQAQTQNPNATQLNTPIQQPSAQNTQQPTQTTQTQQPLGSNTQTPQGQNQTQPTSQQTIQTQQPLASNTQAQQAQTPTQQTQQTVQQQNTQMQQPNTQTSQPQPVQQNTQQQFQQQPLTQNIQPNQPNLTQAPLQNAMAQNITSQNQNINNFANTNTQQPNQIQNQNIPNINQQNINPSQNIKAQNIPLRMENNPYAQANQASLSIKVQTKSSQPTEQTQSTSQQNQNILNQTDRLIAQVEYFQLLSLYGNGNYFYMPFYWEDLVGGTIYTRQDEDKTYCEIDLELQSYGNIKVMVSLFGKETIDISLSIQNSDFKAILQDNLKLLRAGLNKADFNLLGIKIIDRQQTSNPYAKSTEQSNATHSLDIKI